MPFPPTFTNVWDITFPPDTQLANLLGQDIRNFKNDIMQRFSLLSGTLANRPTPETVNATWGGVGFGILYWSTDTAQVFQWNGAAWVDLTSVFIPAAGTQLKRLSDTTTYTYSTISNNVTTGVTIPGASLIGGSQVDIESVFQLSNGTTLTFTTQVGGSAIVAKSFGSGGSNLYYRATAHFVVGTTNGYGELFVSSQLGAYDSVNNLVWTGAIANPFVAATPATVNNRYNITAIITTMTQYYQRVSVFV